MFNRKLQINNFANILTNKKSIKTRIKYILTSLLSLSFFLIAFSGHPLVALNHTKNKNFTTPLKNGQFTSKNKSVTFIKPPLVNNEKIKSTISKSEERVKKRLKTKSIHSIKKNSENSKNIKSLKTPKNNTLSEEEIKYYQEKIGNNYKIMSNVGKSGYCATAYEIEDENKNKFILKIPNNPARAKDWIDQQKSTAEKIKKYYKDYDGSLKITDYVTIGDDFVIEKNLGQQIGKEEFWKSLPEEEILKFINGMAEFLRFTHSKERGNVSPMVLDHKSFKFEDACNYLSKAGAINSDEQKMILDLVEKFRSRATDDEITCLTHNDIRSQNIVYDAQQKQFALIDFESLNESGKLYIGITSKPVAINGIPYHILSKIIDKYNEISDIKVSKEKIKMILKLGSLFEIAVFSKYKHSPKVQSDVCALVTSVFDEFGENITSETICHEVWPMIKNIFEKIDEGLST